MARRLLQEGVSVRTLTWNPDREGPFGDLVPAAPLDFSDHPDGLCRTMQGVGVLYNTYWIRFGTGRNSFDQAVENSRVLFEAAAWAGVGRIVHFSVANASTESRFPYFKGKGQVEEILQDVGILYAIIRPTLVFGEGDLLLNNMAWALRRFPVFPVFGNGDYKVQPVYAEDAAALSVVSVLAVTVSLPKPPGRSCSPSRNCCGCWPRRWTPPSGWCTRRRPWALPWPGWLACFCGTWC